MKKFLLSFLIAVFFSAQTLQAKEILFTLEDRDRIIRIEAKLGEIDKRFEQIDKRFEQIDKRFEQIDKRFEQIDKRFDDMFTFMWILAGIFSAIVSATIGFALWDRRTMIRPFERKVKEIEDELVNNKEKLHSLLEAFINLAQKDEKVAEILKELKLL
ncbi:MAG: hypothetical protein ACK4TF_00095 [Thermodesulfovibrionales bacterium]